MNAIGHRRWAIAEGYIPESSHGPAPEMTSHETACILNAGDADAASRSVSFTPTASPSVPTASPSPPAARSTCASTSCATPSPSRAAPTTRA